MTEKLPSLSIATTVIEQAYQDRIKILFIELVRDAGSREPVDAKDLFKARFYTLLKARRLADAALGEINKASS
jgi:hypothetical protein